MALPPGLVIGGPFDGAQLKPGSRGAFVWIGAGPRVYRKPGKNRVMYRTEGVRNGIEKFYIAEHSTGYCDPDKDGCGGFTELGEGERRPSCGICDRPLRSAGQPA